ncbi:MFS transporter [Streptomyces albireticuli]|uniref:MFS transporter n=1 Tax=Streptomyces albireticuli TaxID=1940 RepID=UPI0036B8357D
MTTRTAPSRPWTETWDPEDEDFWERGARHIARRNLSVAVLCGHLALCVWGMWSALVLFRSPGTGPAHGPAHGLAYGPGGTFLLVAAPVAAWAALRWAGSRASGRADRPDGRERIVLGTAALLLPVLTAAWLVQRPGTPLWVLVAVAAAAGAGGGALSAATARHLASLYPHRDRVRVPGTGGGLAGVAAAQALGLLVIAAAGDARPAYVAVALLPVIALVALAATLGTDDPPPPRIRRAPRAVPAARWQAPARHRARRTVALRAGMPGALLGHCLAFGPVLRGEFAVSPRQAASYALLGALLGWAARSLGGRVAGRRAAGRVVLAGFLGMAVTAALLPAMRGTSVGFAGGFTALCVCGGAGAGALDRLVRGGDGRAGGLSRRRARRSAEDGPRAVRGGGPGVAEALGGVAVLLVFAACHAVPGGSAAPALRVLAAVHGVCAVAAWAVLRRRGRVAAVAPYRPGELPAVPVRMSSRG